MMNLPLYKNVFARISLKKALLFFKGSHAVKLSGATKEAMEAGLKQARVVGFGVFPNTRLREAPQISINPTNIPERTVGIFATTRNYLQKRINSIGDDLSKIVEYNKITRPKGKFVVIDKANSKATLYEGDKVITRFDVGVGESVGDTLNNVSYDYATKTFGKAGRTTPSGEFRTATLPENCANKSDYIVNDKTNAVLLNGVMHPTSYGQNTSLALHQFPNNVYEQRLQVLNSKIKRKGVSTGCINFKTEDIQYLAEQLHKGTPVYILPEEVGNSLKLVELPNNKLWFRTLYKDNERNNSLEMAINKYFGFN